MTAVAADRGARAARFERLYGAMFGEIAGYLRRRCQGAEADDVLAQVFTVAWRRLDDVPDPPGDRLWLFGVARRALAEAERSARRRNRLGRVLAADAIVTSQRPAGGDPASDRVLAALAMLRPAEREALQLVLWDGLSHAEAASVVGCTANAFEIRYRRARAAVRDLLAGCGAAGMPERPVRNSAPLRGDAS